MRGTQDACCTPDTLSLQESGLHDTRVETAAGLFAVQHAKASAGFTFVGLCSRTVLAILDDIHAFAPFATTSFCYNAVKMHQLKFFTTASFIEWNKFTNCRRYKPCEFTRGYSRMVLLVKQVFTNRGDSQGMRFWVVK